MKKTLLVLIILFALTQDLLSQKISFGIKGGVNLSKTLDSGPSNFFLHSDNIPGLNFYLLSDFYTKNIFTFGAEAGYIQKGYRLEWSEIDEFGNHIADGHVNYKTNYISIGIPSKIKYSRGSIHPYAVISPRVDFYTGYKITTSNLSETTDSLFTNTKNDVLEDYKKTVFGVTAGAGVEIQNVIPAVIIVESRYLFDLSKSFDNSFLKLKNRSWEFNVGVKF
jgi:hypothetical protein